MPNSDLKILLCQTPESKGDPLGTKGLTFEFLLNGKV